MLIMNNLEMMRKRLEYQGGIHQEDRMIKDKYITFLRTLDYSYQACTTSLVQRSSVWEAPEAVECRALINPNKLKQDYDDKFISIDYKHGYQHGDVFEWLQTNSHWIIYTQELTEDAYFRGSIRRCRYKINFLDENNIERSTYAAIRGPVETKIDSIQKNLISVDTPNLSLNILMPLNQETKNAFTRYSRFLFNNKAWRVTAYDDISMPNILEVNAEEYYIDRDKDDVDNEIANGLEIKPVDPNPTEENGIQGNTFIRPMIDEVYQAPAAGVWSIDAKVPVCLSNTEGDSVILTWQKSVSGQFTLYWTNGVESKQKTIVVESLF